MAPLALLALALLLSPGRALQSLVALYQQSLGAHPLLTNALTASALAVSSDAVSQRFEREKAKALAPSHSPAPLPAHSFYRSATMAVYGAAVFGGFVSWWFGLLNGWFPRQGMTLARILKKIFVNQLFMSPFLNVLFFAWVVFTRDLDSDLRQKRAVLSRKLSADLLGTIQRSCVYWTAVHLANFSIVPPAYQLLYTNAGFFVWTIYLSYVGYRTVA